MNFNVLVPLSGSSSVKVSATVHSYLVYLLSRIWSRSTSVIQRVNQRIAVLMTKGLLSSLNCRRFGSSVWRKHRWPLRGLPTCWLSWQNSSLCTSSCRWYASWMSPTNCLETKRYTLSPAICGTFKVSTWKTMSLPPKGRSGSLVGWLNLCNLG